MSQPVGQWNPNGGQVFRDWGGRGAQWSGPPQHQMPRQSLQIQGQTWVAGPQGWHVPGGQFPQAAPMAHPGQFQGSGPPGGQWSQAAPMAHPGQFQGSGPQLRQGPNVYHAGPGGWHAPAGEWSGYWQEDGQWVQYSVPSQGPVPLQVQPATVVQGGVREERESESPLLKERHTALREGFRYKKLSYLLFC